MISISRTSGQLKARAAPHSHGARYAALLMRFTQGLLGGDRCRLQCFVDDPVAVLRCTALERRASATLIMLVWETLSCKLSYSKGQYGGHASWIGSELTITEVGVDARVKPSIIEDIRLGLVEVSKSNVLSRKALESIAGKLNHVAGLVIVLRPFLHQIWAALHKPGSGDGRIWKKQVEHALSWFHAAFNDQNAFLLRQFRVSDYLFQGSVIELGTDASPWGLGGWMSRDGVITHYFSSPVSNFDLSLFNLTRGSCEAQQTLECLAILVAVRAWLPRCTDRVQIKVRSDNIGALTLAIKMRPHTAAQAIIARELALSFVGFSFLPGVYHTPGIAHVIADKLSRLDDPGCTNAADIVNHPALQQAVRTNVKERDVHYYRALGHASSRGKVAIGELA